MPLFGGNKRPALTGLTKDEQKRRDALNPEIAARMSRGTEMSEDDALAEVLSEKTVSDKSDFIWPLLQGWRETTKRHYTAAIDCFNDASARDRTQVRALYGAGVAYLQAGMAAQSQGSGVTALQVPPGMSIETLYREAGRCYATALSLTTDKLELQQLQGAATAAEKALATTVKKEPV